MKCQDPTDLGEVFLTHSLRTVDVLEEKPEDAFQRLHTLVALDGGFELSLSPQKSQLCWKIRLLKFPEL